MALNNFAPQQVFEHVVQEVLRVTPVDTRAQSTATGIAATLRQWASANPGEVTVLVNGLNTYFRALPTPV